MEFNRLPGVVGGYGASVVLSKIRLRQWGSPSIDRAAVFQAHITLAVDEERTHWCHTLAILDPRSRSAHPDTRVADAPRRRPEGDGLLDGALCGDHSLIRSGAG